MRRSLVRGLVLVLVACLLVQAKPIPSLAANPNVGYVDFSFGSSIGADPTADKPQSKLWFNDGAWWAVMFHTASNTWHIYRLSWPSQWLDTGTLVDDRPSSRADALWDGSHLYIASLVRFSSSNQARLYRYSYTAASQSYSLDSGFPVTIMTGSAETLALDKDSSGQFWITYTQSKKVFVNRSTTNDATWGTPFVIPGATSLASDDISSLVAYHDQNGNAIGVLWSNHNTPSSMFFAYHKDSDADNVWQGPETIYTAQCAADDHINLKSLQSDPSGAIYAAVKTSLGDSGCGGSSSSALIRLVVRKPNNSWSVTTFGTVADDHTRPLVLLDSTNRTVYMFATSPTSCGIIYMKSTSMDNPNFGAGKGTPFISSSTYTCINNATSTKQTVNASTGLVVMASDESKKFYLHNTLALGSPPADTTPPTVTDRTPAAGATGVAITTNVTATFSEAVTGVSDSSFRLTPFGDTTPVPATVSYNSTTHIATLVPNTSLMPSTTYTASLGSQIADLAGNPLAPVTWSFSTVGPPPDTTPPTVIATTPPSGASDVDRATSVTATFSEAIDSTTLSDTNFTLAAGGSLLAGTVSYDPATDVAALTPSDTLAASTVYTVRISGIKDLAGNPLAAPVTWSFTSAAAPAPPLRPLFFPIIR